MQHLRRFASLMIDRRVPLVYKLLFIGLAGGYLLLPLDVLPDILPLIGIADDATVLLTAMTLFSRYANARITKPKEQTSKQKTDRDQ